MHEQPRQLRLRLRLRLRRLRLRLLGLRLQLLRLRLRLLRLRLRLLRLRLRLSWSWREWRSTRLLSGLGSLAYRAGWAAGGLDAAASCHDNLGQKPSSVAEAAACAAPSISAIDAISAADEARVACAS